MDLCSGVFRLGLASGLWRQLGAHLVRFYLVVWCPFNNLIYCI